MAKLDPSLSIALALGLLAHSQMKGAVRRRCLQMSKEVSCRPVRIDQLFAGPGARADQWRNLVELAEAWSSGSGKQAKFDAALAEMMATEEFHAYPGLQ